MGYHYWCLPDLSQDIPDVRRLSAFRRVWCRVYLHDEYVHRFLYHVRRLTCFLAGMLSAKPPTSPMRSLLPGFVLRRCTTHLSRSCPSLIPRRRTTCYTKASISTSLNVFRFRSCPKRLPDSQECPMRRWVNWREISEPKARAWSK